MIKINPNKRQKIKYKKNGKTFYKILCAYCEEYIEVAHGKAKSIKTCPHCGVTSKWILKPITERVLFEMQEEYLSKIDTELHKAYAKEIKKSKIEQNQEIINRHHKNVDRDLLLKMYVIILQYVSSLLKKMMKNKGFYLDREEFNDKVEYATFLWYEQFTKQPFQINDSWAGQLKWKIREALYKYSDDETNDSLDQTIYDKDNHKNSLMDMQGKLHFESVFGNDEQNVYEDNHNLVTEIQRLFKIVFNKILKEHPHDFEYRKEIFISYVAFVYFLKGKDRKLQEIYNNFGNSIKTHVEKLKLILKTELKKQVELKSS